MRLRDAALAVIVRQGVEAATTRAIAEEAGLNAAMIHYAFESKDDLLHEVLAWVLEDLGHQLDAVDLDGVDLVQAGDRLARAYWAYALARPELQRAQFELTLYALTHDAAEIAEAQYAGYVEQACRRLAEIAPSADRARLDALVGASVALVDGLILQLLATGDVERCTQRLNAGLRALEATAHDLEHDR